MARNLKLKIKREIKDAIEKSLLQIKEKLYRKEKRSQRRKIDGLNAREKRV